MRRQRQASTSSRTLRVQSRGQRASLVVGSPTTIAVSRSDVWACKCRRYQTFRCGQLRSCSLLSRRGARGRCSPYLRSGVASAREGFFVALACRSRSPRADGGRKREARDAATRARAHLSPRPAPTKALEGSQGSLNCNGTSSARFVRAASLQSRVSPVCLPFACVVPFYAQCLPWAVRRSLGFRS